MERETVGLEKLPYLNYKNIDMCEEKLLEENTTKPEADVEEVREVSIVIINVGPNLYLLKES